MSKHTQSAVVRSFIRPGEGELVPIRHTHVVNVDGTSATAMEINLGQAAVPDRKYLADVSCVVHEDHELALLFGQKRLSGNKLRSLLIVRMPAPRVLMMLKTVSEMKSPTLAEVAKALAITTEHLPPVPEEPDQTLALASNMAMLAFSGREACLDFYHSSPFAVAAAPKAQKLAVEPVVRVEMRTGALLAMLDHIQDLASKFPNFFREAGK